MNTQVTPNLGITPWTDLATKKLGPQGIITRIGMLPGGMVTGKPSIAVMIKHEDGTETIAELSYEHFEIASRVFAIAVQQVEHQTAESDAVAAEEAAIRRAGENQPPEGSS
jgi:hypothetical protein